MTNNQQQILEQIAHYLENNPGQRFGQALFNLGINQFKDTPGEEYQLRDIYNDPDTEILHRIENQLEWFESQKK
jgi:hypothetical protein